MSVFTFWFACIIHIVTDSQGLSNFGRSFLIPFGENYGKPSHRLVFTTKQNATIYINNPNALPAESNTEYTIQPGASLQVDLGDSVAVTTNQMVEKKAILVVASQPIATYGFSLSPGSSDGYLALPMEALGTHYVVATYATININGASQIVVAAAEDDTKVTVTVRVTEPTKCGDVDLRAQDRVPFYFWLNAQEEVRVKCDGEITGSHVNSTKPVAVISGNVCAQVPVTDRYCDHLVEMMVPVYGLGTRYLLHTFPGRDGAFFRVVLTDPETQISYGKGLQPEVIGDVAFHHFSLTGNRTGVLSSDKPVLVVGYTLGVASTTGLGDPFMTILPSPDLAPADYFLDLDLKPSSYGNTRNQNFTCYVTAVVRSEFSRGVIIGSEPLVMESADDGLYVGSLRIESWPTTVRHTNPHASVALTTHCATIGEGLGFPAGYTLLEEGSVTGSDDVCLSSPCANGGVCYGVGRYSYKCHCLDVFGGPRCQDDIVDDCTPSPCSNGATCQDGIRSFTCICPPQFTGNDCSDAIPTTTTATTTTQDVTTQDTTINPVQTTAEDTTPATTTPHPLTSESTEVTLKVIPPPPQRLCACSCARQGQIRQYSTAVSVEMHKKEIAREIKEELSVDAKNTSKERNRQQSSPDRRASAAGVAIVSISLVAVVTGFIVITDAVTLVSHIVGKIRHRQQKEKEQQRHPPAERSMKETHLDSIPDAEETAEIKPEKPEDAEEEVPGVIASTTTTPAEPQGPIQLSTQGLKSVTISDSGKDCSDGLARVEMSHLAESAARIAREKSGRWRVGGGCRGSGDGGGEDSFMDLTPKKGGRGRGFGGGGGSGRSGDGGGDFGAGGSPPRHRGSRRKHLLHVRPDTILLHVNKAPSRACPDEDTL